MLNGERQNVYQVYNKIAAWFALNRDTKLIEKSYLDELISYLPTKGSVLDVGCGTGNPILGYLVNQGLNVTGVDASHQMLKIAQANFPSTEFILQDMRQLMVPRTFDALIAWHSFFHLPANEQPAMFQRFRDHLNPNGILLFTTGTELGEAWGMNGGENLFHASLDSNQYERLLNAHEFSVLKHVINDPNCGYATVWMAKREV